jgi:hypothetical protein
MFRNTAALCLWVIAILFVCLAAGPICAVGQTPGAQTITGCLQKGLETGGFFLITNDQHWELYADSPVGLADHVGQTVTVTGTSPHRTPAQEEVSQPYEKKETGTKKHADFQVTGLKVVSATCAK